jgi:hypothetical protein
MDLIDHARGSYQVSLLTGWARWSGSPVSATS